MGVQGLWDILIKAGRSRSLAHLAVVDGFEKNEFGCRAYRVGIDASIWYQHATFSKGGENPELRLLFFRLRALAELPILPLFVFDGRERPKVKRGSRMGKAGSHNLTAGMKKLLDIFGMEWRMAFGEAEAELAHLNRIGIIDAVMTDDVDALVFGAQAVIRNASPTLSGNKPHPALNTEGKASKHHVMIISADAIRIHPAVGMSRGGLILCALLSGGDYDDGLRGFGIQIAYGLARCGFGDRLLTAFERRFQQDIRGVLGAWRIEINAELRTNSRGFLPRKYPSLSLPDTFPSMKSLENYANPICSRRDSERGGGGALRDTGELSLPRIAGFCEDHFDEWGHRSAIIKRFRDLLWGAAVMRVLRRVALEVDKREKDRRIAAGQNGLAVRGLLTPARHEGVGTPAALIKKYLNPSEVDRYAAAFVRRDPAPALVARDEGELHPLLKKIVGSRKHVSTDNILEYRVEVDPHQLLELVESGIKGKHPEPTLCVENATNSAFEDDDMQEFLLGSSQQGEKSSKKPPPDPYSVLRIWLPASIMRQVHPGLVENFEAAEEAKLMKKSTVGKRKRQRDDDASSDVDSLAGGSPPKQQRMRTKKVPAEGQTTGPSARSQAESIAGQSAVHTEVFSNLGNSLPRRNCGFLFTYPDPDDPDMLATEDNDHAGPSIAAADPQFEEPVAGPSGRYDDIFDQISGNYAAPAAKEKAKAPARRKPTRASEAGVGAKSRAKATGAASVIAAPSDDKLPPATGRLAKYDDMFDRILGIKPGLSGRKNKGKAPMRPRASASAAGCAIQGAAEPSVSASKRRKTAAGAVAFPDMCLGDEADGSVRRRSVAAAAFPDLPSPPRRQLPLPAPAPLRRRTTVDSSNVIEIPSDDDAEPVPRARPRVPDTTKELASARSALRRHPLEPSSSQDSGLGLDSFLQDTEVVFDFT